MGKREGKGSAGGAAAGGRKPSVGLSRDVSRTQREGAAGRASGKPVKAAAAPALAVPASAGAEARRQLMAAASKDGGLYASRGQENTVAAGDGGGEAGAEESGEDVGEARSVQTPEAGQADAGEADAEADTGKVSAGQAKVLCLSLLCLCCRVMILLFQFCFGA